MIEGCIDRWCFKICINKGRAYYFSTFLIEKNFSNRPAKCWNILCGKTKYLRVLILFSHFLNFEMPFAVVLITNYKILDDNLIKCFSWHLKVYKMQHQEIYYVVNRETYPTKKSLIIKSKPKDVYRVQCHILPLSGFLKRKAISFGMYRGYGYRAKSCGNHSTFLTAKLPKKKPTIIKLSLRLGEMPFRY